MPPVGIIGAVIGACQSVAERSRLFLFFWSPLSQPHGLRPLHQSPVVFWRRRCNRLRRGSRRCCLVHHRGLDINAASAKRERLLQGGQAIVRSRLRSGWQPIGNLLRSRNRGGRGLRGPRGNKASWCAGVDRCGLAIRAHDSCLGFFSGVVIAGQHHQKHNGDKSRDQAEADHERHVVHAANTVGFTCRLRRLASRPVIFRFRHLSASTLLISCILPGTRVRVTLSRPLTRMARSKTVSTM